MNILAISILILNFLLTLYAIFFKEYFKEKGKNLATKEDIESITEKIEVVKNELSYKNLQKTEWNETNKRILFELYSDYVDLSENHLKNITIYFNDLIDPKIISEHIFNISNKIENLKNNYYKLYIFEYKDPEFINKTNGIINNLSSLCAEIKIHLRRMEGFIQTQNRSLNDDNTIYKSLVSEKQKELDIVIDIINKNSERKEKDLYSFTSLIRKKISDKYEL